MLSLTLELEDGGTVIYDNVISYTVEESSEPSPDEVPEDGDEEREGNEEVDMSEAVNPMDQTEQDVTR